jgi:hypothetical protein
LAAAACKPAAEDEEAERDMPPPPRDISPAADEEEEEEPAVGRGEGAGDGTGETVTEEEGGRRRSSLTVTDEATGDCDCCAILCSISCSCCRALTKACFNLVKKERKERKKKNSYVLIKKNLSQVFQQRESPQVPEHERQGQPGPSVLRKALKTLLTKQHTLLDQDNYDFAPSHNSISLHIYASQLLQNHGNEKTMLQMQMCQEELEVEVEIE